MEKALVKGTSKQSSFTTRIGSPPTQWVQAYKYEGSNPSRSTWVFSVSSVRPYWEDPSKS